MLDDGSRLLTFEYLVSRLIDRASERACRITKLALPFFALFVVVVVVNCGSVGEIRVEEIK